MSVLLETNTIAKIAASIDRSPRKVLRLVALVETITWEPCPDEESALLRENELLGNGGATAAGAGGFESAWRAQDLETLTSFYDTGPKRLRLLRKRHGLGDRLVTAAELDDLGVVRRPGSITVP